MVSVCCVVSTQPISLLENKISAFDIGGRLFYWLWTLRPTELICRGDILWLLCRFLSPGFGFCLVFGLRRAELISWWHIKWLRYGLKSIPPGCGTIFVCNVVCTERIHFLKTLNNVNIPGLSYFFAMSSAHSRIVFLKTPLTSVSLEFDTAGLWYCICLLCSLHTAECISWRHIIDFDIAGLWH